MKKGVLKAYLTSHYPLLTVNNKLTLCLLISTCFALGVFLSQSLPQLMSPS